VINLMDALRRSVLAETSNRPAPTRAPAKKGRKKVEGQKEMLLPITGKKAGRETAREEHRKPARSNGRQRKAG
jgi:DNA end-binding protein Ku